MSAISGTAEPRASRSGGHETLVAQVNAFEAQHDLFARCIDGEGFGWWDLVRYEVWAAIARQRGIHKTISASPRGTLAKAAAAFHRARRLARVEAFVRASSPLAGRNSLFLFNRLTPNLASDLAAARGARFVVCKSGIALEGGGDLDKAGFEDAAKLAMRRQAVPEDVRHAMEALDDLLRAEFGESLYFRPIMHRKYLRHLAHLELWAKMLDRLPSLGLVAFVLDDTTRSLTFLAKRRLIRTREYQHCEMVPWQISFSYPDGLENPATLADEVIVHRPASGVHYPPEVVLRPLARSPVHTRERDIDILVGSSPTRRAEMVEIVRHLVGNGWTIAVKLHPAQLSVGADLAPFVDRGEVTVYDKTTDFADICRRARIYVPSNPASTTTFEAHDEGASVVVVDYDGEKLTSSIDQAVTARANSPGELPAVVGMLLQDRDAG